MVKILQSLLGKMTIGQPVKKPAPAVKPKRPDSSGDFRAVEIAPSLMCCPAAMQVAGRPYLMRDAPRLPLRGCTMPINCSCGFRKHADRRGTDRRLFGAQATRWFMGVENRKLAGRRPAER